MTAVCKLTPEQVGEIVQLATDPKRRITIQVMVDVCQFIAWKIKNHPLRLHKA